MHKNRIFVLYPLGEEIFPNGRGEKPDFSLPTKGRDKYFT